MNIWVDADACPNPVKEIIFRAAIRTGYKTVLVANHRTTIPRAKNISFKLVRSGFDEADKYIENNISEGDLLITNDIPLAADCIKKRADVLSMKGERLTRDNIKERLNVRDFMETLRSSGINTGGPAPLSKGDLKSFGDALDRYITSNRQVHNR